MTPTIVIEPPTGLRSTLWHIRIKEDKLKDKCILTTDDMLLNSFFLNSLTWTDIN